MERHGQFYVSMYNATKRVYWKNLISFYLFILLYILLCILITSEFWRNKKKREYTWFNIVVPRRTKSCTELVAVTHGGTMFLSLCAESLSVTGADPGFQKRE